jgi:hypothetical protein
MRRAAAVWTPFVVFGVLIWLSSVGVGSGIAYRSALAVATLAWFARFVSAN